MIGLMSRDEIAARYRLPASGATVVFEVVPEDSAAVPGRPYHVWWGPLASGVSLLGLAMRDGRALDHPRAWADARWRHAGE